MKDGDAISALLNGRVLAAPICGRYGHVLGYENQSATDETNLLQFYGDQCEKHGEPMPSVPESLNLRIANPDPNIIEATPMGTPGSLNSCHGCVNLVKDEAVYKDQGLSLPLCKAKGTLVFRPTQAKECPWATPGMPQDDLGAVDILPQYREGFSYSSIRALEAMLNNGNVNIEPTTYVTDAPVEPEEAADGIRAWRRIESPYGDGKEIMLPIFDRAYFSEDLQELIPTTGDSHNPELYHDFSNLLWKFAAKAWAKDETLCLISQPGLGKTEFTYWVAWLMQVPWHHVLVGPSTEPDDLFGKVLARETESGSGTETYWQDGRYTEAYVGWAGIVCLDEPNTGRDDCTIPLRSTTDNNKTLTLDAGIAGNKTKLIKQKGKYTTQIWCINPAHDVRNIGTRELAAADMSRLSPTKVPFPPDALERKIIQERCQLDGFIIPDTLLNDMMKVAGDIREASKQGEFPGTWGIREQVQVARFLEFFPFVEAYREAVLNFFEEETSEHVINMCIKLYNSDGL
jgi:hypothetical protein